MQRCSWIRLLSTGVLAILLAPRAASAESNVAFEKKADRLEIRVSGRPFGEYVWNDQAILRPFFTNLRVASGNQVTRRNPPIDGKDATDHATMHPGLWLAFGELGGSDFWRNKGRVRHAGFVDQPASKNARGTFSVRNQYVSGESIACEELCRIAIDAMPNGALITWDSQFSSMNEFLFGDQEEMGLGIRMATPITVKNGGRIVNSDGQTNERDVWGKPADWCDYSGTINGEALGITLMPDPANFRRSWYHARDYGLLVANPFGRNAFTKSEKSQIAVKPGETFRLRFGVFVHSGPVDLPGVYREWSTSLK